MPPKLLDNTLSVSAPRPTQSVSLPPALVGLLLQFAAFLLAGLLVALLNWNPGIWFFAFVQGALATILARLARLPGWWLVIEFLFAPALCLALRLHLPAGWYLAGFILLSLVYWSVFSSRVPLFLSSQQAHLALQRLMPTGKGIRMIDLGCGVGGVLTNLSQHRPDVSFHGVETAPLPYLLSKLRMAGRRNCSVRWGSFWQQDMGSFDLVYAYLSPAPMAELWQKLRREMKPGSLFVSNTFVVDGIAPDCSIPLGDLSGGVLHVWRM